MEVSGYLIFVINLLLIDMIVWHGSGSCMISSWVVVCYSTTTDMTTLCHTTTHVHQADYFHLFYYSLQVRTVNIQLIYSHQLNSKQNNHLIKQ